MLPSRLRTRDAENIGKPLWIFYDSTSPGRKSQLLQRQIIRSITYPNYYGGVKTRPKLRYTIDNAVELLREQCGSNPKSMVSMHAILNLDWRIKAQRIAGIFDFPYSTGKLRSVAAATLDLDLAEEALKAGANHAGDIGPRIIRNDIQWPRNFDLIIATPELAHSVSGRTPLGRKLKRHKIVPCLEFKTIVEPEELSETVRKYAYGFITQYRNDMHGNITTKLGKFEGDNREIIDNFHHVLRHLFDTQLTQFGNGPDAKQKNIGKYILAIHVVASQGDSYELDLDTIDILKELNQQDIPLTKNWKMKKIKN
jgi:ribosomal protein L1